MCARCTLRSMQRRGWTVAVGAVLVAVLTWLVLGIEVPYVAYAPGPTVDTLRTDTGEAEGDLVVKVEGTKNTTSEGELRLVTVSLIDRPPLIDAVWYWFSDEYAVVPREFVYPPDKSEEEIQKESKEQFASSQDSAETAALRELGCPVSVVVTGFTDTSPLKDQLKDGDVLRTLDDKPITSVIRLRELLESDSDAERTLTYQRGDQTESVTIRPDKSKDELLGLYLKQRQPCKYDVVFDTDVQKIGGPSAGLMFALSIIDKVKPEDLTGGRVIAGTGEIDDEGRVGPIGGVPQKLIAAKKAGATVFLTPKANCDEAVANDPGGLLLVEVSTLDDALDALEALRNDRRPRLCRA